MKATSRPQADDVSGPAFTTGGRFVIVTESGMLHRLRREMPDKHFIPGPTDHCACADCRYMKMNTLEKLRDALANLAPEIVIPEEIRARAELPIRRMLELSV